MKGKSHAGGQVIATDELRTRTNLTIIGGLLCKVVAESTPITFKDCTMKLGKRDVK